MSMHAPWRARRTIFERRLVLTSPEDLLEHFARGSALISFTSDLERVVPIDSPGAPADSKDYWLSWRFAGRLWSGRARLHRTASRASVRLVKGPPGFRFHQALAIRPVGKQLSELLIARQIRVPSFLRPMLPLLVQTERRRMRAYADLIIERSYRLRASERLTPMIELEHAIALREPRCEAAPRNSA